MADVCEKLDEITLEFFEKFELLQKKRSELCSVMRDGYLCLSQARYTMGNKSVGALQYSDKMEALTSVRVEDRKFELEKITPEKDLKANKAIKEEKEDQFEGLRRRKVCTSDDKLEKENVEEIQELESSIREIRISTQDPIKWFGVLVPGALRTGQKNFTQALDLCCEIANLENDLVMVTANFKELKTKKNDILEKQKESGSCD